MRPFLTGKWGKASAYQRSPTNTGVMAAYRCHIFLRTMRVSDAKHKEMFLFWRVETDLVRYSNFLRVRIVSLPYTTNYFISNLFFTWLNKTVRNNSTKDSKWMSGCSIYIPDMLSIYWQDVLYFTDYYNIYIIKGHFISICLSIYLSISLWKQMDVFEVQMICWPRGSYSTIQAVRMDQQLWSNEWTSLSVQEKGSGLEPSVAPHRNS